MKAVSPAGERTELLTLNIGPSHPAMHGALRVAVALDGEEIAAAAGEIGYLHRCFEKVAEQGTWQQVVPYTDRLNYCSAMMNNVGYCKAVEAFFGVSLPERGVLLRVIACELSRMIDHLVCVGANLVDMGALTNFWYCFNPRETVYRIWDKFCGARLTNSFARIGGLYRDAYPGFEEEVLAAVAEMEAATREVQLLAATNPVVLSRTRGVAVIPAAEAVAWGWTGPNLRASGVDRDLRKDEPYYGYETYDFETAVGATGDCYDRIFIRLLEVEESARIVRQAVSRLKPGPVDSDDPRLRLPAQERAWHDMEALITHFKLVSGGVRPPAGELYDASEAANGELGFTLVSDGGGRPYRVKPRPPCFPAFAAFPRMVEGHTLADLSVAIGTINIIAGELDR